MLFIFQLCTLFFQIPNLKICSIFKYKQIQQKNLLSHFKIIVLLQICYTSCFQYMFAWICLLISWEVSDFSPEKKRWGKNYTTIQCEGTMVFGSIMSVSKAGASCRKPTIRRFTFVSFSAINDNLQKKIKFC